MQYPRSLAVLTLVTLTLAPCAWSAASADDGYVAPRVLRVHYADRAQVKALSQAGADIAAHGPGWVDVVVEAAPPKANDPVYKALAGVRKVEVRHEDLDRTLDRFKDRADLGAYHTLEEMKAELDGFVRDFPALARLETVGQSCEKRTIYALKISDNVAQAEGEPGFLIQGLHHSREWITVEVPLAFARKLLTSYATDASVKKLVDEREIWIVPVVNPDGYVYSTTQSRMWRKNRRKNSDNSYGVDPNRNYSFQWGGAGASSSPGSDTYRGAGPASEPEVKAMETFAAAHKNLRGAISFHSYGNLILWPWSYTEGTCPDDGTLGALARDLAKVNGYTPEKSSDLYPSSGDTDDYMYGVCGMASFTFELANDFIPDESDIGDICTKNVAALTRFVTAYAEPFPVLTHQPLGATTNVQGPYGLDVTFNASHFAAFGLQKVLVHHKKDGAELFAAADMVAGASNVWHADLPGQGLGTYHYFFEAVPAQGPAVRYPAEGEFSFQVVDSLFLLVDDDGGKAYEKYYLDAFADLGLPAQVLDRSKGAPGAAQLAGASAVVWFCGDASSGTLDKQDQDALAAYLKKGGRFILFGQDIAYELKQSAFLADFLKAQFVEDNSGLKTLGGVEGTCLAGVTFSLSGGDAVNQGYPEVLAPLAGARKLCTYLATREGVDGHLDGQEKVGALAVEQPAYRLAYFGFGLEGVDGRQSRKDVLGRAMAWVRGASGVELRAGAAVSGLLGSTDEPAARRALALAGATAAERLERKLLGALEAGRFDAAAQDLGAALDGAEALDGRAVRPLLRTLGRKLAGDERPGARELRARLQGWLERE